MIDPLHQFEIIPLISFELFGLNLAFTNASLAMLAAVLVIIGLLEISTVSLRLIPSRTQAVVESLFFFVRDLLKSYVGEAGLVYFPFVLSLFLFILFGNLLGLFPGMFTFTSHIIVTFALASLAFGVATLVGITKHGWHFLSLFCPKGIPLAVAPLLIIVEIISYFSRPISLAVRLFANMVAGHVMLKIFAGFAVLLLSSNFMPLAILPIAVNTLMNGFELLIAILQAYVFTILTCIYLNDAIHLH